MPRSKRTSKTVETLRHEDASRKNIPTAEYQVVMAEVRLGNHVLWQAKKARAARRVSDVLGKIKKVGSEADKVDKEIREK